MWAINSLNSIYHGAKIELSDVDFIIETVSDIYFIEYKNANISGAANPSAFHPESDKSISKIARKYYDSYLYVTAIGKVKPCSYIYILEYPLGDTTTRKMLRNKISTKLPFLLQKNEMMSPIITEFEVLSIFEWNAHQKYSQFPLSKI